MAANPQIKSAELLRLQQERQYFFKHYRRGDSEAADDIVAGNRQALRDARRLLQPAPGRWRGLRGIAYQNRVLKKLVVKENYEHQGNNLPNLRDDDKRDARKNINVIAPRVWKGHLQYIKTLGWGGHALATLWECTHRNKRRSLVVMKMPFQDDPDSREETRIEKNGLTMLRRAPHILQRVYINEIRSLNGDVDPRPINNNVGQDRLRPGSVNIDRREREVDEDHRFLLLEFMKYGNLDVMIKKLEVHRNNWNNRFTVAEWNQFLWHLFDCLIKACIAMELPPRHQSPNVQNVLGGPLPEIIPPANAMVRKKIVHFDLDPQNVLVRGFDNATHNQVPQFAASMLFSIQFGPVLISKREQISDLGFALQEDDVINDANLSWDRRLTAKWGFYAPEQFTKEWDAVDILPTPQEVVAGKYSRKTNIYQVGQILWCCITLMKPNDPPICREITYGPNNNRQTRWSWGYELYENENGKFDNIDADLRLLVAKCMFNEPDQRPNLGAIQPIIAGKLSNAAGNRWRAEFGNPRRPRNRPFDITRQPGRPVPKVNFYSRD